MLGGMFAGAATSSVMDTIKYNKACDESDKIVGGLNKMKTFYSELNAQEDKIIDEYKIFLNEIVTKHDINKKILEDNLKKLENDYLITQSILSTSIAIICVLFVIKYFFGN